MSEPSFNVCVDIYKSDMATRGTVDRMCVQSDVSYAKRYIACCVLELVHRHVPRSSTDILFDVDASITHTDENQQYIYNGVGLLKFSSKKDYLRFKLKYPQFNGILYTEEDGERNV